jgi:hypothetical protein
MTDFNILGIQNKIAPLREQLLKHELYQNLEQVEQLKGFMEFHVFAVWDFMVLLKSLQTKLTCVNPTWVPTEDRVARRLINDIVLAEESDLDLNGQPASHYEMYLDAMKQVGADLEPILRLEKKARVGHSHKSLVKYNLAELPKAILEFLDSTYEIVKRGKTHEIAAAFTFGREDLIPDLFTEIVRDLNSKFEGRLSAFVYYLERHIEIDGDEHGPMAERMIRELCGNDQHRWREAERAAILALEARLKLWNAIAGSLQSFGQALLA